jgi:hypothetical protein
VVLVGAALQTTYSQLTKQPQRSIYLAGKIQLADQFFFSLVEGAISSK